MRTKKERVIKCVIFWNSSVEKELFMSFRLLNCFRNFDVKRESKSELLLAVIFLFCNRFKLQLTSRCQVETWRPLESQQHAAGALVQCLYTSPFFMMILIDFSALFKWVLPVCAIFFNSFYAKHRVCKLVTLNGSFILSEAEREISWLYRKAANCIVGKRITFSLRLSLVRH